MRILVTGATGHIGQAICQRLRQTPHEVIGLSRGRRAPSNVEPHVQADIGSDAFVHLVMDQVKPCDAIVHAAACLSKAPFEPLTVQTNCVGMHQMLRLAQEWNVKRFIYTSGVSVIGSPSDLPITERHPLKPGTPYLASKLFGELLADAILPNQSVSLRISSPVGPHTPDGRIFSTFIQNAAANKPLILAGQGKRAQNYIDVRDIALCVECALRATATGPFNVGGPETLSNHDLALRCIKRLNSGSAIQLGDSDSPDDMIRWEMDLSQARDRLGFTATYSMDDSISAYANCLT